MEAFIGQIQAFGFNFSPRGWAPCDGRLLSISQYSAVFSLLGTAYGGDGQTTFALPDLRGRHMINQGQAPGLSSYTIGEAGGLESTQLNQTQMPMHTHPATAAPHNHTVTATATIYALNVGGDKANPQGRLMGSIPNMYGSPSAPATVAMDPSAASTAVSLADTTVAVTVAAAGGSQPFDNRSPYLCINMSICLEGIFPSRN